MNPESCGPINPDILLFSDATRSSPVLYREYCSQDGNLVPRFSQGRARCKFRALYAHALLQIFPEESWVLEWIRVICIRIRVDVEIFESGKKKLRIQIYPNTCGRGLILVNRRFNVAAQNKEFPFKCWKIFLYPRRKISYLQAVM